MDADRGSMLRAAGQPCTPKGKESSPSTMVLGGPGHALRGKFLLIGGSDIDFGRT